MKRTLPINRRQFLAGATAGGASLAMAQGPAWAAKQGAGQMANGKLERTGFWPGDARLVISISMQFEAGASLSAPGSGQAMPGW
ncbi:twin-arginine translocation signal domain-containing protein [Chromobacterium phragmitis]|uniref:Twin-arginine translocation signal domain-containing protein n=1 Tax=Chromobacterium phragmitis TaxID=2202141 RepID=A0ABV0INF0_9NEIS